jgi:predicted aspartyl protease
MNTLLNIIKLLIVFILFIASTVCYSQNEFLYRSKFYPASEQITYNSPSNYGLSLAIVKDNDRAMLVFKTWDDFFDQSPNPFGKLPSAIGKGRRIQGNISLILRNRNIINLIDYNDYYEENGSIYSIYKLTATEVNKILESDITYINYYQKDNMLSLNRYSVNSLNRYDGGTIRIVWPGEEDKEPPVKHLQEYFIELFGNKETETELSNLATESIKTSSSFIIPLVRGTNGTFEIPVIINDVLKINLVFDSGASSVFLSPDVVLTLLRTGSLKESDFIGNSQYKLANGSILDSKEFNIKSLKIGTLKIENVKGSVSENINSSLLFGQSAIEKLGKYTIDYDGNKLIIER